MKKTRGVSQETLTTHASDYRVLPDRIAREIDRYELPRKGRAKERTRAPGTISGSGGQLARAIAVLKLNAN